MMLWLDGCSVQCLFCCYLLFGLTTMIPMLGCLRCMALRCLVHIFLLSFLPFSHGIFCVRICICIFTHSFIHSFNIISFLVYLLIPTFSGVIYFGSQIWLKFVQSVEFFECGIFLPRFLYRWNSLFLAQLALILYRFCVLFCMYVCRFGCEMGLDGKEGKIRRKNQNGMNKYLHSISCFTCK